MIDIKLPLTIQRNTYHIDKRYLGSIKAYQFKITPKSKVKFKKAKVPNKHQESYDNPNDQSTKSQQSPDGKRIHQLVIK